MNIIYRIKFIMTDIKFLPRLKDEELQYVFGGDKDAEKRYLAAKLVADGCTQREAAEKLGTCPSYVNKWVVRFKDDANINCFQGKRRGPTGPTKLIDDVVREVINAKLENPDYGGDRIYKLISNRVDISLRSTYRILKKFKDGEYTRLLARQGDLKMRERNYHTSYGGSFLLNYYYNIFEIPSLFSGLGLDNRTIRLLLYYSHGKLMGMENIHDMYNIEDDGIFFANGLSQRPHQTQLHDALGKLGQHFIEFQLRLMKRLQDGYLLNLERISLDPHFISYFGKKKKVAKNWDAVRRYLHPGYRPLYAYDLEAGCCFYALWINEHYKGYKRLSEIIDHINKGLSKGRKIKEVYMDREFYCFDDLRELVDKKKINFTIPARKRKCFLKSMDGAVVFIKILGE